MSDPKAMLELAERLKAAGLTSPDGTYVHGPMKAVLAAAQPTERDRVIEPDLVQRCHELLEWGRTGLLAGGKGGAIRALADKLREKIGDTYALSVAESQTKDEAMREIVRLAALKSGEKE